MDDLIDYAPEPADYRAALLEGLSGDDKSIPCKFLYDARGSELFEEICELDAYYPTRTELAIMQQYLRRMARWVGPRSRVVEFGSGSGLKTRLLLESLDSPVSYLPIDISRSALRGCAASIADDLPDLDIVPICADYTEPIALPEPAAEVRRTVAYFPGSTIGNFEPGEAVAFLSRIAEMVGPDGGLVIGADQVKSRDILERAYDDPEGVTAAFNLNLLRRANREAGADFELEAFAHQAVYNADRRRIETYLVSRRDQTVAVGDERIEFREGERIWTEHSYKYTPDSFRRMAEQAGFAVDQMWTDEREWFGVWALAVD
jgi:dimethylhistidine N-methyltransferase